MDDYILGFGFGMFGAFPIGVGQFLKFSSSAKLFIKSDKTRGNANFIEPSTGDYVIDMEDGSKLGCNSAQQLVYLRLFTDLDSSILPGFGSDIIGETINERTVQIVTDTIQAALKDIIENKTIELININVSTKGEFISILIEWKDISTNTIFETSIS